MTGAIQIGPITVGGNHPPAFIMGPCVMENEEFTLTVARKVQAISTALDIPIIFKASYDKANRTSIDSFRGPGFEEGLKILQRIRDELGMCVTSDVHHLSQVEPAAEVLDLIQIPAFLCRQTDLVVAAARTGRPLNIKKGQFMAPEDMSHVARKVESVGNHQILFTERGTCFGYHRLVVDLPSLYVMRTLGYPVIFDATHSVQMPGAGDGCTVGRREFVPVLARGAMAAGVDGLFFEVHPDPDRALCDGANSLVLDEVPDLLDNLLKIHHAANSSYNRRV